MTWLFFTCCMINTAKPEAAGPTLYPQKWATGTGTASNPWANNCLNTALTNCPTGGTIYLKAGYYTLSALLPIYKKVNIIGEDRDNTIIVLDITNASGVYIDADYVTLKGFTVDGASQTDGVGYFSCIAIGHPTNYLTLEDIEVKNAGEIGINYGNINHSKFQNIYAHDNYHDGLHSSTTLVGRGKYNTYRDIYCWNNGTHGFDDGGVELVVEDCHNLYDNIQAWDNGTDGIVFWLISGGIVSNCSAWGNGNDGIVLGLVKDFDVHDCTANFNDYFGIRTVETENINFTNVIAKNNNVGIAIEDCRNIVLTSCQSYDDRDIPLQLYGIQLTETNTGISLSNCKLSPNAIGEIYNPAGAVVTVITKKKFPLRSL